MFKDKEDAMARRVKLKPYLSCDELKSRWESCKRFDHSKRWHLLWLVQSSGVSLRKAAPLLGHTLTWARTWVHRYNLEGPSGIEKIKTRNPNPPKRKVHPEMRKQVYQAVIEPVPLQILWS